MQRRIFLGGLAGILAAGAAPAIIHEPMKLWVPKEKKIVRLEPDPYVPLFEKVRPSTIVSPGHGLLVGQFFQSTFNDQLYEYQVTVVPSPNTFACQLIRCVELAQADRQRQVR
jgi:hypothetical protein